MAKSLMETIQQNLMAPKPSPLAGTGATPDQGAAASLLRAKTGKADVAAGTGPAQSSIAARVAESTAKSAADQLTAKGQISSAQIGARMADVAQREDIVGEQLSEQDAQAMQRIQIQRDDIISKLESEGATMDARKKVAALEQAGFLTRLENKKYVEELTSIGRNRRLDNDQEFKVALLEDWYSGSEKLVRENDSFRRLLFDDSQEFTERISQMKIQDAIEIAEREANAANAQAKFSAAGSLFNTAVAGGTTYYNQVQSDNAAIDNFFANNQNFEGSRADALAIIEYRRDNPEVKGTNEQILNRIKAER